MAALVHLSKTDTTLRTTTSTAFVELTNYTIPWSDLTTAGFANGDEVAIIIGLKTWNASVSASTLWFAAKGSAYSSGMTSYAGAFERAEPVGTDAGNQILFATKQTLATNDNLYIGGATTTSTGRFQEFQCLVLKLSQLSASDWLYAEAADSGAAPTSYDVGGAGAATAAAGDWLLFTTVSFSVDSTTTDMLVAIHDGAGDVAEIRTQAENASDFRMVGTMAYRASLGSGVTVRARYAAPSGDHDVTLSTIFGLRLDVFANRWGAHTTNTVTHSVVDTYTEFTGNGSFSLGATGPLVIMGWPIHNIAETTKRPYGRIQIGGSDWPAANANRVSIADNGTASKIAPFLYGYSASQGSGTLDIDLDCAEDADVTPNPTCTVQVAVAFSLELAGAPPPPAGMVHPPAGRRFQHMIVR